MTPHSSADHADDVAQRVDLSEAIEALPPRDLECLRLADWEQLTAAAAAVMGCSTVAYKVRLHRARRRLAAMFAAESEQPSPKATSPTTQPS